MMFRDLRADEIECRIQSVKEKGLVLLLYKNARCDMNILDETVGCDKWQREHYECKGNLFCKVGILFDNGWVWKSDCGTESNTEAEKGEASDSFKRACFNWGIGRELYTAPFIWVSADRCNINGGKCYDRFCVDSIEIIDKRIVGIVIKNASKNNCVAFSLAKTQESHESAEETQKTTEPDENLIPHPRTVFLNEIKNRGITPEQAAMQFSLTKSTTTKRYIELLKTMGVDYGTVCGL